MQLAATLAWLLFGALFGILHAWLIWRGRGGPLARIGLVGAALVGAALARGLLPAAAGWLAGLLVHGLLLCGREAR